MGLILTQRISRKAKFIHNFSGDKVFLDNTFQNFWRAAMIPRSLGINDGDGPPRADPQAVCLGAIDQGLRADQLKFLESRF